MIRLTLVVALFICTFTKFEDRKIVGGASTNIKDFPWQISLQTNGSHICGGSILNNNIIVTAAHCLQSVSPPVLRVRAGSSYSNSGGVLMNVTSFKIHPSYNAYTNVYDIAIVHLSSALVPSSSIKSIGLATSAPTTGTYASVTGWGNTIEEIQTSTILQKGTVKVVCRSDQCTYGSMKTTSLICPGDSGGPLVCEELLIGVVSRGIDCSELESPGIFSDVAFLRSWIESEAK